jgi:hypothetical protein
MAFKQLQQQWSRQPCTQAVVAPVPWCMVDVFATSTRLRLLSVAKQQWSCCTCFVFRVLNRT